MIIIVCYFRKPSEINRILINVSSTSLSHFASIALCLRVDAVTDKKRTRQKRGDTTRTSDILNLMISLPRWVYKKIFRAIISWPILSSHNIISLKSFELLPHDSHPRFVGNPRIVYVFRDLISFAVAFSTQKLFHRCPRDIIPRPELHRTPPIYHSSCFVAGSTVFRSACADAGPIFQRIIRIPLSRDRICHPMRFSLFLPDCTGEYRCRVT